MLVMCFIVARQTYKESTNDAYEYVTSLRGEQHLIAKVGVNSGRTLIKYQTIVAYCYRMSKRHQL